MTEGDYSSGDIIETVNGNRYLFVELEGRGLVQFYVGNSDPTRIPKDEILEVRPTGACMLVGKAVFSGTQKENL
jgi:hypothetical protein